MIEMDAERMLHQLRTAYLPPGPETDHIYADLSSLSTELARLEALIEDLFAQREKVKEAIDLKRALLSPVRRLPDDLLQDIFLACLPTHRDAVMSPREPPLVLCQICSFWRALALATPTLWASLHLPAAYVLDHDERTRAAAQWIERSAACPLSISISASRHGRPSSAMDIFRSSDIFTSSDAEDRVLQILVQSAPRWRNVTLRNLPTRYLQEFGTVSTPLLQTVRITDRKRVGQWLDVFGAPSVRTLALHAWIGEDDEELLLPRLSHITHLSISSANRAGMPGNIARSILTTLTQLVSLKIAIHADESPRAANRSIHFPVLESLDLHDSWDSLPNLDAILSQLVMPRLCHLAIGAAEVTQSNTPFFAAVSERSPLLQSLAISLHNFSREGLRETLHRFPSLAELVVRGARLWDAEQDPPAADAEYLLICLTEGAETFSSLRVLESTNTAEIPDETVFKFLQSRVDAGGGFRLQLHFLTPHPLPDVEQFRSQGLDITMTNTSAEWVSAPLTPWSGLLDDELRN
ncbi:hypothetical protein C8R43DRAFT_1083431 [Mycena crocata]|nr:hypothetical protein C8R43DRAFT_1083431 [Mycena crocata]